MNFTPEKDYEGLLLQTKAMHRIIEAMEKSKSIQGKAVDDLTRQLLICGKDHLESEREANKILTDQVLRLEQENEQLKYELNIIKQSCPDEYTVMDIDSGVVSVAGTVQNYIVNLEMEIEQLRGSQNDKEN